MLATVEIGAGDPEAAAAAVGPASLPRAAAAGRGR